jgi:hypothetical protein
VKERKRKKIMVVESKGTNRAEVVEETNSITTWNLWGLPKTYRKSQPAFPDL